MNEINPHLYNTNFNSQINKYINNTKENVKNNINNNNNVNKKRIYLNTYIIPIFFLIFSYYYSKYYYLNKRIMNNNEYLTKINNLNILFTYENPIIKNVNESYYKYFKSLNKNKNNEIDINEEIYNSKKIIFENIKNINLYLFGSNKLNDIKSKISDLEKNKSNLNNLIIDKLIKINSKISSKFAEKYKEFVDDNDEIISIKPNIINFIDIIINDKYSNTKQDINIIKNNIYKILKDQNQIDILNINKNYLETRKISVDRNKEGKIESIIRNYNKSLEIYKEYLNDDKNINENQKNIKKNIFKKEIRDKLNEIINNSNNKNTSTNFIDKIYKLFLGCLEKLSKLEYDYITIKFKENNSLKIYNDDNFLNELKKEKENFKLTYEELKIQKNFNVNKQKKEFNNNLKKINNEIQENERILEELEKENESSKKYINNKNYKKLNNSIKKSENKLNKIITETPIDINNKLSKLISIFNTKKIKIPNDILNEVNKLKGMNISNENTEIEDIEQILSEIINKLGNWSTNVLPNSNKPQAIRFKDGINSIINDLESLITKYKQKNTLQIKINNERSKQSSYEIKSIQLNTKIEYYKLNLKNLENIQNTYIKLQKENNNTNSNNKSNLFLNFFTNNIKLASLIYDNIYNIKFKNEGNKIFYYYDNDKDLKSILKILENPINNIRELRELKMKLNKYLSNSNSKNSKMNKNIFMINLGKISNKINNNNSKNFNNYFLNESKNINTTLKKILKNDKNLKNNDINFTKKVNSLISKIKNLKDKIINTNQNKKISNNKNNKNSKLNNRNVIELYPYTDTLKLYLLVFYTLIIIFSNLK